MLGNSPCAARRMSSGLAGRQLVQRPGAAGHGQHPRSLGREQGGGGPALVQEAAARVRALGRSGVVAGTVG